MALHPSVLSNSPRLAALHSRPAVLALRVLYLAGVSLLLYLWLGGWGYDDPYITYRYASNLAHGAGFVYNPGEQVQSTTTPLFALLLAALSPLPLELPALANLVGALSIAAGAFCLYALAQAWKAPWVGWAALAWYPFFPLLLTTLGSETPLYLALCSASFLFYARGSYKLTAAAAALAALARPDGILVPALIALHYLFTLIQGQRADSNRPSTPWSALARQVPWTAGLIFLALLLGWFVFAWAYFGSPLPVTLAAKQSQGTMAISQQFAAGFVQVARDHAAQTMYQVLGVLAGAGLVYAAVRARSWWLYLGWTAAYFAAYTALGVSRYYWYYAPLAPGFIAAAGLGVQGLWYGLTHILKVRFPASQKTDRILPGLGLGISLGLLVLILGLSVLLARSSWSLGQRTDPRLETYRDAGQWLNTYTPAGAQVGALEIGVIGYYADRPIIDFAGLLQPETTHRLDHAASYDEVARWAFQRYRPDYVVVQEKSLPGLEFDLQAQDCSLEASFPASEFGTRLPLHVYACETGE